MMKKKYGFFLYPLGLMLLLFASCSDDNDDFLPDPVSYTTLIYMAADNSMDSEVDYTLEQLKAGVQKSGGTAVVYLDREDETPRLFRISTEGTEILLMSYDEENSASAETLARVLEKTKELVPADRYGLIYWSHSMGWLPRDYTKTLKSSALKSESVFPRTRYLGIDDYPGEGTTWATVMEVNEMTDALPDQGLEYIWFDVCLMGGVEPLYQLRNKCRYLVASPTEVLMEADYDASGVPYAEVLPYLFGGETELTKACQIYYNHYNGKKQEILRSATISLVNAGQLDGLYREVSAILNGKLAVASAMDVIGLQVYHQGSIPPVFFDFRDVVKQLGTTAQQEAFEQQLAQTVIYKAATGKFVDLTIDPDRFSGLSCYIPLSKWQGNTEYDYYFTLAWSDVYGEH